MVFTETQTTYLFQGRICGLICSDCPEPLSIGKVKLYRTRATQDVTALAVADPKETFAILTDEEIVAKAKYLIAEAEPDAEGNFKFELGAKQQYGGEAFDVDFECGTVPHGIPIPRPPRPLQFSITTIQPQWRSPQAITNSQTIEQPTPSLLIAAWEYCIPSRYWCAVRARFGAWTICGRVVDCSTQKPVREVKVFAYDTDIFQDDALGSAITDSQGKFRIDYTREQFQKTPLSPWLNFEIFSGPDLYFRVESGDGTIALLDEPRLRGRQPDRSNVGNCFCIELCIEPPQTANPIFTQVGDFNIVTDIEPTTGLTRTALFGHGGPDFAFFGNLKLKGYCRATAIAPGGATVPLRYRFLYQYLDVSGAPELPITGELVQPTTVAVVESTFESIVVAPPSYTPPVGTPQRVIVPDADGWVTVDSTAWGSLFGSTLIQLRSNQIVSGGFPVTSGDTAGNAPVSPKNGRPVKLIFEAEPLGGGLPRFRDELAKILINNWNEEMLLNLQQFIAPGADRCSELSNAIDIQYTVDHEFLRSWGLSIGSAAIPPVVVPALPSGPTVAAPRGSFGTESLNISTWKSCSYTVALTTQRKLTDGETDDSGSINSLTFCK
jgi:hypothetical protein